MALVGGGLHLWQGPGFVFGGEQSKPVGPFGSRSKLLMIGGTEMLKPCENFISHIKQYAGKTFTTQIESLNFRLRHYLAKLHLKTLCYSKSKMMLEVSLKLLIHKLNNP